MKLIPHLKLIENISAALIVVGFAACSHGPVVNEFPDTASATEEIHRLDSDLLAARISQSDVLAPSSFEEAQEALDRAKARQDKKQDAKAVLHAVAVGRSYLERATEASSAVIQNMEEVVAARKQALSVGARSSFAKELESADADFQDVTSRIEKNDTSSVERNRRKLQAAYLNLELKAITQNALGQARATMEQADKEGAKVHAVRSLAETEKKIKDTDAYIVANRHETDQIQARSMDAERSADHLLKITRDSKANKKTSSEDLALKIESGQNQVLDERAQVVDKEAELSDERKRVDVLAAQRNKLELARDFDQRYEAARAEFTSEEAEVYRQGDTLTVRLKGLIFPVAKSELRSANYPLMAKVQKVIKGFGKSTVSIEGYTDSDGGKAMNDKLSAARAQAVSAYLVATATIAQADITSVGNGYQKPLASNKSSHGKGQNRRVDVVITPQAR